MNRYRSSSHNEIEWWSERFDSSRALQPDAGMLTHARHYGLAWILILALAWLVCIGVLTAADLASKKYSVVSALDIRAISDAKSAQRELKRLRQLKDMRQKTHTLTWAWAQLRYAVLLEERLGDDRKAQGAYEEILKAFEKAIRARDQKLRTQAIAYADHAATAGFRAAELVRRRYLGTDEEVRYERRVPKKVLKPYQKLERLSGFRGPLARARVWYVESDGTVRSELLYEAALRRLDEFYSTYFSYQLLDALVNMTGRNPNYSYGIAVILLTLIVRVLLFPLNRKAYKSMQAMQKLQPELQKLQRKYKRNPEKLNREMLALYRRHNVSPLGGCLPMLIQFPILIGVYWAVIYYKYQFLHASFLWIRNLAQPDFILFGMYFVSLIASQRLLSSYTTTTDPQQRQMQQMLTWMFPLMVLFFFWSFPAAFILYWLTFNITMTIEQYFLKRAMAREEQTGGYPVKSIQRQPRPSGKAETATQQSRADFQRKQSRTPKPKPPQVRRVLRRGKIRRYFR